MANIPYQMKDAASRWNSAAPADQNWYVSRGYGPGGESDDSAILASPWQQYQRVLDFRGAQMNPRARAAQPSLPAGYTEGQLDTENEAALSGGPAPRYLGSDLLPSSKQRIMGSLAGLQRASGRR